MMLTTVRWDIPPVCVNIKNDVGDSQNTNNNINMININIIN